jgi:hypothetical protein
VRWSTGPRHRHKRHERNREPNEIVWHYAGFQTLVLSPSGQSQDTTHKRRNRGNILIIYSPFQYLPLPCTNAENQGHKYICDRQLFLQRSFYGPLMLRFNGVPSSDGKKTLQKLTATRIRDSESTGAWNGTSIIEGTQLLLACPSR